MTLKRRQGTEATEEKDGGGYQTFGRRKRGLGDTRTERLDADAAGKMINTAIEGGKNLQEKGGMLERRE